MVERSIVTECEPPAGTLAILARDEDWEDGGADEDEDWEDDDEDWEDDDDEEEEDEDWDDEDEEEWEEWSDEDDDLSVRRRTPRPWD